MKVKKQENKNSFNSGKESSSKERVNPFELKINKKKHSVLDHRLRHDRGNPGISRNKINKRRLDMLQKSTQMLRKSNSFVDRRFGQFDDSISKEDLIVARMTQARQKKYKKNIYNLNDEEDDYFGKALLGLENPAKPLSDSEDEDDAELNANFVNEMHFGGFLTKKSEGDEPKSRKETIENIIIESKKRKAEKKAEKEMTEEMTDELDKEWKEMLSVVSSMRRKDDDSKTPADSYDVAVRELRLEPFSAAKNLKTEEQLNKETAEKLKRLEQERISRMNPIPVEKDIKKESVMSADSLYDGIELDESFDSENISQEQFQAPDDDQDSNDSDGSDDEMCDTYDLLSQLDEEISDGNKIHLIKLPSGDSEILTLDSFSELVKDKSLNEISSTIDSLLKDNHPSLREGNKIVLANLFAVIINYLFENIENCDDAVGLLNIFVPCLHTLSQSSPDSTGASFQTILMEKYTSCNNSCATNIGTLFLLKLAGILYSTSDYRHPVVTIAFLIMSDLLSTSYKITAHNLLSRLFICGVFYEYLAFSKRFSVEAINFLKDSLYLSSSKIQKNEEMCYEPQQRNITKKRGILVLNETVEQNPKPINFNIFCQGEELSITNDIKILITYTTIKQLQKFSELYSAETVFPEIFTNAAELCKLIPAELYPSTVGIAINEFIKFVKEIEIKKMHLKYPSKRPRMLKMLEPNFEMGENSKKKVTYAKKLKEEKEISQKIKREQKGAIREVRRDAQFLARQQLRERMEADAERKMKVKKLCQELAMQEGECKKFSRKK